MTPSPQIAALIAAAKAVLKSIEYLDRQSVGARPYGVPELRLALQAAEAAPIQPAPGVVTDAMVEAACKSFLSSHVPHPSFEGAMRLSIEAALAKGGG